MEEQFTFEGENPSTMADDTTIPEMVDRLELEIEEEVVE